MKFLLLVLIATPALAEKSERTVSVQGECSVKVAPDRASVDVSVEKTAPDAAASVSFVSTKIDAARAEIAKLKLPDQVLETTHFSVYPHREWENNKSVMKGYRASQGLSVTTSQISKLGDVIAAATKAGLTTSGDFRPFLSTEKRQAEYLKCLDVASKDALKKAQRLAESLNAKVGEVLTVQESPMVREAPPQFFAKAMSTRGGGSESVAAPTIDVADQSFSTTLQVTFKLK